jgi:hypothetical protein
VAHSKVFGSYSVSSFCHDAAAATTPDNAVITLLNKLLAVAGSNLLLLWRTSRSLAASIMQATASSCSTHRGTSCTQHTTAAVAVEA